MGLVIVDASTGYKPQASVIDVAVDGIGRKVVLVVLSGFDNPEFSDRTVGACDVDFVARFKVD